MELIVLSILVLLQSLLFLAGIFLFFRESMKQINHLCDRIQTKSAEQSRFLQQVVENKTKEEKSNDGPTVEELVGF
jgi:hypothetical protein